MSRGALAAMAVLAAMGGPVPNVPVRNRGPGAPARRRSQAKLRRLARRRAQSRRRRLKRRGGGR